MPDPARFRQTEWLAVFVDAVGNAIDFRKARQEETPLHMYFQITETAAERDVLFRRRLLLVAHDQ